MTDPKNLTEDLPQLDEELESPHEKKRTLTEDLPQEDEEPESQMLTEDL